MIVAHHPGGGVVGEQVIHRGGHLEGALVAVAAHAGDPLRVGHARAQHAADLLRQGAQARRGRIGVVAAIHPRLLAAQVAHGRRHAALELVVIVGIEQVVLAVVLVVHHEIDAGQTPREVLAGLGAVVLLAVGVAAPLAKGARQVGVFLPGAAVDQALQAGAVGAGFGPVNAVAGAAPGLPGFEAARFERARLRLDARADRIHLGRLVQIGKRLYRRIEKPHHVAEGVAEEPRYAQRHIDAGAIEEAHRQNLEIAHPAAAAGPLRAHAEQRESLRDIVAAGAHGRGAPYGQADAAGKIALFLLVFLHQPRRRVAAELPTGRRGDRARVDRKEIAPGGQHIGTAAGGRAARPRGDEAPGQSAQQLAQFLLAAGVEAGRKIRPQALQHARRGRPAARRGRGGRHAVLDQRAGQALQALAGVAAVAPRRARERRREHGRPRALPWRFPGRVQRIEVRAREQVLGQGADQTGVPGAARADRIARQREQGVARLTARGAAPEHVQTVANLAFFQLAQVGVGALEQGLLVLVAGRWRQTQIAVQMVFERVLEDLPAQQRRASRVHAEGLVVLVQQAL